MVLTSLGCLLTQNVGEVSLFWCWSVSGGQLASKGEVGCPEAGVLQNAGTRRICWGEGSDSCLS